MKKLLATGIVLLALLALLAGCSTDTSLATEPRIDSIHAETMVSDETTTLADNTTETMGMTNVEISITVSNFEAGEMSDNVTVGEEPDGHYIYYMDEIPDDLKGMIPEDLISTEETTLPMETETTTETSETTMETITPSQMAGMMGEASTETSYTWEDVEPGYHVFAVQLVDNDGMSLVPAVVAVVILSVPEPEEEMMEEETTTETEMTP